MACICLHCGCSFDYDVSFDFCSPLCEFEFILLLNSDIPF